MENTTLTINAIIKIVNDYTPWWNNQLQKHGWLNQSYTVDDLQQSFIAHCLQYDIVNRYDPDNGAKVSTYIYGLMINFINAKFRTKFSAAKRRPQNHNIESIDYQNDDGDFVVDTIADDMIDTVDRLMTAECYNELIKGLKKRGDTGKVALIKEVLELDGNIAQVAKNHGTQPWIIRQSLRRLAGTPIGRVIRKEFFGKE